MGSIPGSGRSPGEGNGNQLQYSCLGSPMDRAKWWGYSPRGHERVRHNSVEQWGFKGTSVLSKEVSVWGSDSTIWGAKMNSLIREEAKPTQETWETQVWSLGQNDLEEAWQPTPVLPGDSHSQRSLAGYSPCCHKESDTTEVTQHTCTKPSRKCPSPGT